jgi:hypothetical protein
MKTQNKILLLSLFLALFTACDNYDRDIYFNDSYTDIATVENPDLSSRFLFRLDNNLVMWTAATNLPDYFPKDGQRIIAEYRILSEMRTGSSYDYNVKLIDAYSILTKEIFKVTPATNDSIGHDSVYIDDMWIGSDYLNVEFTYPGNNKIHFINLVSDSSKVYTDGKIHLEFRHNANGDSLVNYKHGIVSFKLNSLKVGAGSNSLILVIHVNVPNKTADKLYTLKYNFGASSSIYLVPKKSYPMQIEHNIH